MDYVNLWGQLMNKDKPFSPDYDTGAGTDSDNRPKFPEATQSETLPLDQKERETTQSDSFSLDQKERPPLAGLSKFYGVGKPYRRVIQARII